MSFKVFCETIAFCFRVAKYFKKENTKIRLKLSLLCFFKIIFCFALNKSLRLTLNFCLGLNKDLFFLKNSNNTAKGCRSEEHTSELQSLMRISYAVFCLKQKNKTNIIIFFK